MSSEPSREEINRTAGPLLLEFGAEWCPLCQAMAPQVAALLSQYPGVRHIKVEDGRGLPLGRSFRVKLWPTFAFLRDGEVKKQLARPSAAQVREGLEAIK